MNSARKRSIPNKLYFRIGEVSDIVGVKPYVLRYWETEFSDIRPTKSKSGQRLYKRRDVEMLLGVRDLLYDQRYTIDGAKQRLRDLARNPRLDAQAPANPGTPQPASPYAVGAPGIQSDAEIIQSVLSYSGAPPTAAAPTAPPAPSAESRSVPISQRKLLIKLRADLENVLQELHN